MNMIDYTHGMITSRISENFELANKKICINREDEKDASQPISVIVTIDGESRFVVMAGIPPSWKENAMKMAANRYAALEMEWIKMAQEIHMSRKSIIGLFAVLALDILWNPIMIPTIYPYRLPDYILYLLRYKSPLTQIYMKTCYLFLNLLFRVIILRIVDGETLKGQNVNPQPYRISDKNYITAPSFDSTHRYESKRVKSGVHAKRRNRRSCHDYQSTDSEYSECSSVDKISEYSLTRGSSHINRTRNQFCMEASKNTENQFQLPTQNKLHSMVFSIGFTFGDDQIHYDLNPGPWIGCNQDIHQEMNGTKHKCDFARLLKLVNKFMKSNNLMIHEQSSINNITRTLYLLSNIKQFLSEKSSNVAETDEKIPIEAPHVETTTLETNGIKSSDEESNDKESTRKKTSTIKIFNYDKKKHRFTPIFPVLDKSVKKRNNTVPINICAKALPINYDTNYLLRISLSKISNGTPSDIEFKRLFNNFSSKINLDSMAKKRNTLRILLNEHKNISSLLRQSSNIFNQYLINEALVKEWIELYNRLERISQADITTPSFIDPLINANDTFITPLANRICNIIVGSISKY